MSPDALEVAAVIFDFDGVIIESTDIKTQAFAEMFEAFPEHHEAIVQYHRKHFGLSRYKKFIWIYAELLKQPLTQAKLAELGEQFSQLVFDKVLTTPFVPGALECLERLHSCKVPAVIASGTPQEELKLIVELRGLSHLLSEVWGSPNEKSSVVRSIRTKHRLNSREMLFVGDGFFDFHAAHSEGVPFLARDSGAEDVDWAKLGVPVLPDLTPLSTLEVGRPVHIGPDTAGGPHLTVSLREPGPRSFRTE